MLNVESRAPAVGDEVGTDVTRVALHVGVVDLGHEGDGGGFEGVLSVKDEIDEEYSASVVALRVLKFSRAIVLAKSDLLPQRRP